MTRLTYPALARPLKAHTVRWCPEPAQWDAVADALLKHPEGAGFDTEYYDRAGGDARKGFAGDKDVHVWSVALPTGKLHPRGYHVAQGVVLPQGAFRHAGLRLWLESKEHLKLAHNGGVDVHATEGTTRRMRCPITLAGVENTLELVRYVWPEMVAASGGEGFDLKGLMVRKLGMTPVGDFSDLFVAEVHESVTREVRAEACTCGVVGCRKRKGHSRPVTIVTEDIMTETRPVWLPDITPEHPLFPVLVPYAGEDAVAACQVRELALNEGRRLRRPLPW